MTSSTTRLLGLGAARLLRALTRHPHAAMTEPIGLAVPALGIRDGCVALEGAGLDPCTLWVFHERTEPSRVGFPVGRDVRSALVLGIGTLRWSLGAIDGDGFRGAPDAIDLELAAAVADSLAGFLVACEDAVLGVGPGPVERTFVIPALSRVGLVRLRSARPKRAAARRILEFPWEGAHRHESHEPR